jgi:transcriptional regulator with XRE-family HTH domain
MPGELVQGRRLNKRRKEMNLSLRDLAARTQLTASFLSQVERGITNPSLNSLQRIAEALNVPLLFFLSEDQHKSRVVRAQNRPEMTFSDSTIVYELLTPDLSGKFEVVSGILKPGTENIVRRLSVDTEEFIIVIEGSLLVGLVDEDFVLNSGDTIYFDGSALRRLTCASSEEVRWISVITPPVF